ncbi:thiamine pyrophosphate-dependent enzyme [Permianibacter aggregans]|uniref:TPP-dependent 2-oxoacid decarboxylase n=1 Tax=Permianibacter aggregans TaxID=1510150 RepID=A0A4R6UEP5_9GAMM|nr:thiamine pyrophosphate-dependent enzyme [Permianibacter aggregans]TDQ43629.1 TPP-dependent 2-oxoacid decarboxylase [Permianibacter aggregans]
MLAHNIRRNFGDPYLGKSPTLGDALVSIIRHFGGQRVFGVGGDFAAGLIAALDPHLQVLPASNEMHAGFAACADAEIGGIGFCLTTYTVGSLPCVSAAALAKTESLPVIFISGAPGESEVHQHAIHHTVHPSNAWRVEYDAALRAFAGLGIRAERLQGARHPSQPNIAGYQFYQLVKHAWLHREPVFIEIPRDLVQQNTQALALPILPELRETQELVFDGVKDIANVIADKISKAKAPLVYIGEQLKLNRALQHRLLAFCEQYHIPYATSWFAKGLFDDFSPLCLGSYNGVFTDASARQYIDNEVDYVLDIGSSIFEQDTGQAFQTCTHRIATMENKTVVKSTLPHEQDLRVLIDTLMQQDLLVKPYAYPVTSNKQPVDDSQPMDFNVLADTLNALQQHDNHAYVYVPEVGNSYFASFSLKTRRSALGRSWLANPWYAAMGTSLPYARVACEHINKRGLNDRVVVITGDGGFHFQLNELIHFQKEKLPVTIVYMRNNVFDLGRCGEGPIYHCSDTGFDVHALIKAYGGQSKRCTTVAEFKQDFSLAVSQAEGITLLEIPCTPTADRQCREVSLLNLYIRSRNGFADAIEQWQAICGSKP